MLSLEQEHISERCKGANSGFRAEVCTSKIGNPGVGLRFFLPT